LKLTLLIFILTCSNSLFAGYEISSSQVINTKVKFHITNAYLFDKNEWTVNIEKDLTTLNVNLINGDSTKITLEEPLSYTLAETSYDGVLYGHRKVHNLSNELMQEFETQLLEKPVTKIESHSISSNMKTYSLHFTVRKLILSKFSDQLSVMCKDKMPKNENGIYVEFNFPSSIGPREKKADDMIVELIPEPTKTSAVFFNYKYKDETATEYYGGDISFNCEDLSQPYGFFNN